MAASGNSTRVHATCVAIGTSGVLIRGPSGAGKSDLALRLLHATLPDTSDAGAIRGPVRLVSDDQVQLDASSGVVMASAVQSIAGQLEVRGIGIVRVAHVSDIPVRLIVDAVAPDAVSRMPEAHERTTSPLDVCISRVKLNVFEPSAVAKVLVALEQALECAAET